MRVDQMAKELGAEIVALPSGGPAEILRVYAGDRMSDLLNEVDDKTLLVTNLLHPALARPIELMDIAAVCFLNGVTPEQRLVEAARDHGAAVLVSPFGMYETCGRLYQLLGAGEKGRAGT